MLNKISGYGITDALSNSTTVNDVSVANLKIRLAGGFGGNAVQIGDNDDTVTIPGDLVVTGTTTTNNVETVSTSNGIIFEGNAADANEITLLAGTVTADRTITLPNATGTVALTSDIYTLPTNNVTNASVSSNTLTLTREGTTDVTFTPSFTQRAISSTPTNGATTTAISSDWAFDNVKTAVPSGAVFTDTNTVTSVGISGNTSTGTIILAGSGATSVSKSGGTITISSTDTNTVYSLPAGSSSTRGGFKIGYSENGKNYPVEVSSERMFVNVPWTDTNTTYSTATTSANGLMSSGDKTKLNGIEAGADVTPSWVPSSNPGYTTNSGDITSVTAGTNLSGGGSSGGVTLNVVSSPSFTDVTITSDARTKKDVNTIDNALDKVNNLRGVEFTRIKDEKRSIGVIAQELETILPELVSTDDEGMKSVNYAQITGVLIEAVKELSKQVEELKRK